MRTSGAFARHGFWLVYVGGAVLALLALWGVKYLPMTDLPQHAAQVSIVRNLHDPAFGFEGHYEIHWFTPYCLGTLIPLLLSECFGLLTSMKLLLSLIVLSLPLCLHLLMREVGADPWWALAGFLVFFGQSFYWGFVSYLLALPLGVLFAFWMMRHRHQPSWSSGVMLSLVGVLVFFAHGIVFAVMGATAGVFMLLEVRTLRALAIRFAPLLALLLFFLVWLAWEHREGRRPDFPLGWGPPSAVRWFVLPANLVGLWTDPSAQALGWGLLVVLAIGMGRSRTAVHLVPLATMVLLYDLLPAQVAGGYFVYERTAVFVLVFALTGFAATSSLARRRISRAALSAMVLVWMGVSIVRFQLFDARAHAYDVVMKDVPPRSRVLALMFDRAWEEVPEAFLHFPAWHQAERGGALGYSFAQFPVMVARYLPGKAPLPFWASQRISWKPARLKWRKYPVFDYYVVRSAESRSALFEDDSGPRARLVAQRNEWWVYQAEK
jgi:hypothetical protein